MKELIVKADTKNLEQVINFINTELESRQCSDKIKYEIDIAVEEIYVNIANYAYSPKTGEAWIRCEIEEYPLQIVIQFLDNGRPYNPLQRPDPDINLGLEERQAGGLGIYLVKQSMTSVNYEYLGGKNILTIRKELDSN
ncbi:MAG: ATP-binding protein [Lachnospiraceae bacterium]|nr:ATP-binding protein [Lachnospiraceae bacterium]